MNKKRNTIWIYSIILFWCYMVMLIYFLFFSPDYSRFVGDAFHYNLIPFREIRRYLHISGDAAVRNIIGNVVAFIPFGLLITEVSHRKLRFPVAAAACLGITVLVEIIQLITRVGVFDVDDIILNFCGGLLGLGLYYLGRTIISAIRRRKQS